MKRVGDDGGGGKNFCELLWGSMGGEMEVFRVYREEDMGEGGR